MVALPPDGRSSATYDPRTRPRLCHNSPQNVAIGFKTDPVAFGTAAGAAVTRNSQRCRRFASRPINSRSQLSKIGMPIETITNSWIGCGTPSTPDGMTSLAPSPPNIATSRALSQRAQEAYNPAKPASWTLQGPLASRRAQRPFG